MKNLEHIIPHNTITLKGNVLKIHRGQSKRRGGGIRGMITAFTSQSQGRMVDKLLTLEWGLIQGIYNIRFVTLTTPFAYWRRLAFVYGCLDRMRRLWVSMGMAFCFTRKEFGSKRGMLHFHCLVFIPKELSGKWEPEDPAFKQGWIERAWSRFLGYDDRVRVTSEIPECWHRVERYITKYCMKAGFDVVEGAIPPAGDPCSEARAGGMESSSLSKSHNAEDVAEEDRKSHNGNRFWYIWGADNAPWAEEKQAELDGDTIRWTWELRRVYRKAFKVRARWGVMRRELGKRAHDVVNTGLEPLLKRLCGEDSLKRVQREVSLNKGVRYLSKGGFFGWRLWMNEPDFEILSRCMNLQETSKRPLSRLVQVEQEIRT